MTNKEWNLPKGSCAGVAGVLPARYGTILAAFRAAMNISLLISFAGCAQEPFREGDRLSLKATPPTLDGVINSIGDLTKGIAQCRFTGPTTNAETPTKANQDPPAAISNNCVQAVYVWSEAMPLSWIGIENVTAATEDLGVQLALIEGEGLGDRLDEPGPETGVHAEEALTGATQLIDTSAPSDTEPAVGSRTRTEDSERALASELIRVGATVHYPALVIFDRGATIGPAILGFKTEDAYRSMIAQRLNRGAEFENESTERTTKPPILTATVARGDYRDVEIEGHPGAYFRHIPGKDAVGFEVQEQNYTLDLADGERYWAPGIVDLVPTPDGLFIVTPRDARGGLEFYTVADVFSRRLPVASTPTPPAFQPFYVDREMVDQYPSVGILEQEKNTATYRVLTSWFDGILHRDYEVQPGLADGQIDVRPLGKPLHTCSSYQLSTPIMSKDGREVAARDEATGTTKIFRINRGSSCDEVLDIGMQTGKVAWDSTGQRIAFAIPRGSARDQNGNLRNLHGVFVLDRENLSLMRVPGSTDMNRLTFPEFVDDTTVMFLIRDSMDVGGRSRFRLFCCLN